MGTLTSLKKFLILVPKILKDRRNLQEGNIADMNAALAKPHHLKRLNSSKNEKESQTEDQIQE